MKLGRVTEDDGGLYLGNSNVTFDGRDINVDGFKYKRTTGLYKLIFKKESGKFTIQDVRSYRDILKRTHAARVRYDPGSAIAANRGHKYVKIVKPILTGTQPQVWWAKNWKSGGSLQKQVNPGSFIDYKYWDDPNELVNRLRLLIASQSASH